MFDNGPRQQNENLGQKAFKALKQPLVVAILTCTALVSELDNASHTIIENDAQTGHLLAYQGNQGAPFGRQQVLYKPEPEANNRGTTNIIMFNGKTHNKQTFMNKAA